jgi:acyl dehydratase
VSIKYPDILDLKTDDVEFAWQDRDAILYAIGIGMGDDPLNSKHLPFVYERNLQVLPSFATVVVREATPGPLPIDFSLVLDGERDLTIHKPLDGTARVLMNGRVIAASDKGLGKGAIITREVTIRGAADGEKIATVISSLFARGDGGFGGPRESAKEVATVPTCAPDLTVDIPTRPGQALVYRLSGDRNPLHCDPEVAARAGFDRPILHGLCTYGICCRAILETYADFEPAAIKRLAARFSAPCYPGDVVSVDLWKTVGYVAFQARVKKRDVTVIKNGRAILE